MTTLNAKLLRCQILLGIIGGLASAQALAAYPDCPEAQVAPDALETWRTAVEQNASSPDAALKIEQCFPNQIPACLKRVHDYSETRIPVSNLPDTPKEAEMRTPPSEMWGTRADGTLAPDSTILFRLDKSTGKIKTIEQVARENGWPMVRYKSRHSGGFDQDTASLLMIRVPGDRRTPPVDYDQYINIALPADSEDKNGGGSSPARPVPRAAIPTQGDYNDENSGKSMPHILTIVTVEKASQDHPAKVFMSKFMRETNGSPYFTRLPNPNLIAECYACHANGVREISPLGYHVNSDEQAHGLVSPDGWWQAAKEMNNSMMLNNGFHLESWPLGVDATGKRRPLVNPEAYGPSYGPVHPLTHTTGVDANGAPQTTYPTRTEAFITGPQGCASSRSTIRVTDIFGRAPGKANIYKLTASPAINWQKVAGAMNCATCHNNRVHGSLNARTDISTIEFKILVDQSMPVGAHRDPLAQGSSGTPVQDELNANERIALTNCLEAEFAQETQALPAWFNQTSCAANQSVPAGAAAAVSTATVPPPVDVPAAPTTAQPVAAPAIAPATPPGN